jgi:hypothetical protein
LADPVNINQDSACYGHREALMDDGIPKGLDTQQVAQSRIGHFINRMMIAVTPTRALVVVYNNQVIAELYAKGFTVDTQTNGLVNGKKYFKCNAGYIGKQGKLNMASPARLKRGNKMIEGKITLTNLAQLNSGLRWWGV